MSAPEEGITPSLPDELARQPHEPLLPVEKWLIAGSLLLGFGLLGILFWLSQEYFSVSHEPLTKGVPAMQLTSTAFKEGETIPKKHTADGDDVSPALAWSGVPAGVQSFALICDDPDAPRGTWVHWVLFNLPAEARELSESAAPPAGARQGTNDFRAQGYGGPSPPPGKPHRYYFKLYALDTVLSLKEGATKAQVEAATKGHVLAEGQLMGKYGR